MAFASRIVALYPPPKKDILHQYMANIFKELYPRTVLIDAVEFRGDSPSLLDMQSACYSYESPVGLSPLSPLS